MSSPTINRWGLNTFWYHFWYTDKYYTKYIQQDALFIKLLNLYLYFGLYTPRSFFYKPYWFYKKNTPNNVSKYFRYITVKNRILHTVSTYRLRSTLSDIYPMRLWFLRYSGWIIINVYWFQPFKPVRKITRKAWSKTNDYFITSTTNRDVSIVRLKTLLLTSFFKKLISNPTYLF